jgi:hypothetical protein
MWPTTPAPLSMFGKLFSTLTGRDEVERAAAKDNLDALLRVLKTRPLLIPRRPLQFLDPAQLTEEQLLAAIQRESAEVAELSFEPWVLAVDGRRRLPAFSSQEKMSVFAKRVSTDLKQVFALSAAEVLLADIPADLEIDIIALNPFSEGAREFPFAASVGAA